MRNSSEETVLARVAVDLACNYEKLNNLHALVLVLGSEHDSGISGSEESALVFDFLSGFLNSEVKQVEVLLDELNNDVSGVRDVLGDDKLKDIENSLKKCRDLISEIRQQSVAFRRNMSSPGEEYGNSAFNLNTMDDGRVLHLNTGINMNSEEEQRNILSNLEKSLAREMELDKQLHESKEAVEQLKLSLLSTKRELAFFEDEAAEIYGKWFNAENTYVILMGLLIKLQNGHQDLQLKLSSSLQRKSNLRLELEMFMEKTTSLEKQFKDSQHQLADATSALKESKEQQDHLLSKNIELKKMTQILQQKLSDAEILKSEAITKNHNAEVIDQKILALSKTNLELNKELGTLQSRIKYLEACLKDIDKEKMETSNAIASRLKTVADLILKLASERERLQKQHARKGGTVNTTCGALRSLPCFEDTRRVDVGMLNMKHVFLAVLISLVPAAYYVLCID